MPAKVDRTADTEQQNSEDPPATRYGRQLDGDVRILRIAVVSASVVGRKLPNQSRIKRRDAGIETITRQQRYQIIDSREENTIGRSQKMQAPSDMRENGTRQPKRKTLKQ
jgi:hypothetical protein